MAVTFSDLHTEAGLKTLEGFLGGKTYISGDQISKDDVKVFAAVAKPGDEFPNVCRWYQSIADVLATRMDLNGQLNYQPIKVGAVKVDSRICNSICCTWIYFLVDLLWFPGEAGGVKISGQVAVTAVPSSASPAKVAAGGEDDDDLDLFGDETEEEKKAAEEREASVKASSKKKESGKSSVLLDIKPWDDETDMKKLEEAVRSVQMEGLLWGASKLVPVGYGIKKLQIMMTIVDDLVSVDSLIEEELTVEPRNEYIQSCDIVAFNKI